MGSKKVRPNLPTEISEGISTPAEDFQNKVLRPIIKMQSDVLIAHLQATLKAMKIDFNQLSNEQKEISLQTLFFQNQSFKREVIGMIMGHFTVEEYSFYSSLSKELNRRITQIVLNRCLDLLVMRRL